MADRREALIYGGLALLGAGGLMLLHNSSSPAAVPPPTPPPPDQGPGQPAVLVASGPAAPPGLAPLDPFGILAKIKASGPYYSLYDPTGKLIPIGVGDVLSSNKVSATNVLQDAINQAKLSACNSYVTLNTTGGVAYRHDCGIATRQTFVPAPPAPPSPPLPQSGGPAVGLVQGSYVAPPPPAPPAPPPAPPPGVASRWTYVPPPPPPPAPTPAPQSGGPAVGFVP